MCVCVKVIPFRNKYILILFKVLIFCVSDYTPPPRLAKSNINKRHKLSAVDISHHKSMDCALPSSSAINTCNEAFLNVHQNIQGNENNQNDCNVMTIDEISIVIASNSSYTQSVFENNGTFIFSFSNIFSYVNVLI